MQSQLQQNLAESAATLETLSQFDATIEAAATALANVLRQGGRLLTCGNGGSASEAGHLSTELVVRYKKDRQAYAAICLNANGGDLTAIGNDYDFTKVFERQVEAFGKPGDFLVAFSSSGNSKNIHLALEKAKELGLQSLALLGKDGGICNHLADYTICIPGTTTARIQEAHLLFLHTLCDLVEARLGHA